MESEPHIKAHCGHMLCKNWRTCNQCDICNCICIMAKCSHGAYDKCDRLFIKLPCSHYVIENCDCELTINEYMAYQLIRID